ncbi:MAG: thioesterase [Chloroflexi bacterium]|nr:thioesterase [Chloroflexota bacterium]
MTEDAIKAGLSQRASFTVAAEHSAAHIGSGSVGVLSTPSMIAFMEITARRLLDEHLPDTHTTVGVEVNVRHLAACPIGAEVEARVVVLAQEDRKVRLGVEVWQGQRQLGAGEHLRVIVDKDQFLAKALKASG